MPEIKKMQDTTAEDYREIGLKSGLEIHQQLDTEKKLFCRCPILPYSEHFDAEILRHMRPTLSELGEYDGTALMEFKTKKEIIYQINKETVCTYEMDDTPPFELNQQALDIALEVTMLLNCKLVSEVHIARKQYLDGSIPTGFQRTTILGVDGWIPYRDGRIGIIQLGLEEDACREVSDNGHTRVYRTDRLGIPLIETVTYPEMKTPREVAEVAEILRWLVRSTGKVRRGIGAARMDVNVSVEGGTRIEIKGVPRIPRIPLLVHNEAYRQVALLSIKKELAKRKIDHDSFKYTSRDITDILKDTRYYPVAKALGKGLSVRAVTLRGYRGILLTRTQPETTFAREISDRVRVIACLDRLPNIAHSDMEGETFSSTEWTRIKKAAGMEEGDSVIVVWGGEDDLDTAVREIAIRAEEAIDGVPSETRQALPDGTNGFERILPGPNRMYPDTDLPPLAISEERIERVSSILSERPWERETRYAGLGLDGETASKMSVAAEKDLFDELCSETGYEPRQLADLLLVTARRLIKKGVIRSCSDGRLKQAVLAADDRGLPFWAVEPVLVKSCGPEPIEAAKAASSINPAEGMQAEKAIKDFLSGIEFPEIEKQKLINHLTGEAKRSLGPIAPGKVFSDIVGEIVSR